MCIFGTVLTQMSTFFADKAKGKLCSPCVTQTQLAESASTHPRMQELQQYIMRLQDFKFLAETKGRISRIKGVKLHVFLQTLGFSKFDNCQQSTTKAFRNTVV